MEEEKKQRRKLGEGKRGRREKKSLVFLPNYFLTISGGHQIIPHKYLCISNDPDFFQTFPHEDEDLPGSFTIIITARTLWLMVNPTNS